MSTLFDAEAEPAELLAEPEPQQDLQAEPARGALVLFPGTTVVVPEVMPEGFKLSERVEFVADVRKRDAAASLAATALAIDVTSDGGIARADVAVTNLRGAIAAIEADFEQAKGEANKIHKRITGTLAEWTATPREVERTVSKRIVDENRAADKRAADAAAVAQAAADEAARADAAKAVDAALATGAAPQVVETLRHQAETATAPPVSKSYYGAPASKSTTESKKWKARFVGTPDDAEEPNPDVDDLTPTQQASLRALCAAIGDGTVAVGAIKAVNWGYLNTLAAAEQRTLNIAGIEPFEHVGARAKRARRS